MCKTKKKILTADPELFKGASFLGPKWSICPKCDFFWKSHFNNFHVPLGHFPCAKSCKILRADPGF